MAINGEAFISNKTKLVQMPVSGRTRIKIGNPVYVREDGIATTNPRGKTKRLRVGYIEKVMNDKVCHILLVDF